MLPTIQGQMNGGLPAVYAKEYEANRGRMDRVLHFVSTDDAGSRFAEHNMELHAADPADTPPPFQDWFYRRWAYLHPDAHTFAGYPADVLDRMYTGAYETPLGTPERMFEHCERYPLNPHFVDPFIARYRSYMDRLLQTPGRPGEERIVNWQDPIFFAELQAEYADRLRAAGYRQTCHVHTVLPAGLNRSPWGAMAVEVMGKMDTVYVHTERYRENLLAQLPQADRMPDVRRFDLAIDMPLIRRVMDEMSAGDPLALMQYEKMTPEQRTVVDEILRTKEGADKIPHRFICIDRLDQGKGITTLIDAIDRFLESRLQAGETMDDLRRNYRFFGLNGFFAAAEKEGDEPNLWTRYVMLSQERYKELIAKYPGVIFACDGVNKAAVTYLVDDCHALAGSVQDGLNLAWPEIVWANAHMGRNRSGIMAGGAGFALEGVRRGFGTGGELPAFVGVNDPAAIAEGIRRIVETERTDPEKLGRGLRRIARELISVRTDSVIVDS